MISPVATKERSADFVGADLLAQNRLDDDGAPGALFEPVRLRFAPTRYRGSLDGAWWPRGRTLSELTSLVSELSRRIGPIRRVSLNADHWPATPRRLPVANGPELRIGRFHHIDADTISIGQTNRDVMLLLVIPPETNAARGNQLLQMLGTTLVTVPAAELLAAGPIASS